MEPGHGTGIAFDTVTALGIIWGGDKTRPKRGEGSTEQSKGEPSEARRRPSEAREQTAGVFGAL